ncbi:MAG: hypothetical protein NTZ94_07075 [Verrucomicrobia bacterium]|nr:hypothetical protein [Verrucomicrobiota bacterium]
MEICSTVREDITDHADRQNAEDASYEAEYRRWVDGLSPDEKARLEALGVGEAMLPNFRGGNGSGHADHTLTAYGVAFEDGRQVAIGLPEEATDADVDRLRDFAGLTKKQADDVLLWNQMRRDQGSDEIKEVAADRLAKFFAHLLPKPPAVKINPQLLGLRVLGASYLLNRNGNLTMTELASRAGVSKQLLDHHVRKVEGELDFHGWGQKSIASREAYSEAAKARWALLSPEERKARRAGNKQSPTPI